VSANIPPRLVASPVQIRFGRVIEGGIAISEKYNCYLFFYFVFIVGLFMKFNDVLDAIDEMDFDERASISDILYQRVRDERRSLLVQEVKESSIEYSQGFAKSGEVSDLLSELSNE